MTQADPATESPADASTPPAAAPRPGLLYFVRVAVTGVFMGVANLIPGVSGGTMVLALGLYQEFIDSVADLTALRFSRRRIVFLGVLGLGVVFAILTFVKLILLLLFHFPVAMFALFIGLTLGGAPLLVRRLRPLRPDVVIAVFAGLGAMILLISVQVQQGFPHNTAMDFVSGIVGATTMVLPGVSGSYVLLVMGQYERILGAIDDRSVGIIAPVGIGAVLGIVVLSNALKWLLHHHHRPTVGVLLGILLGSVIGLWPFTKAPGEKALERRSWAELAAYAQKWQLALDVDMLAKDEFDRLTPEEQTFRHAELVRNILAQWDTRRAPTYTTERTATAVVCVVVGFAVTCTLARREPSAGDTG
jgi:putative membrane protein